jgi:hypothetical protein
VRYGMYVQVGGGEHLSSESAGRFGSVCRLLGGDGCSCNICLYYSAQHCTLFSWLGGEEGQMQIFECINDGMVRVG